MLIKMLRENDNGEIEVFYVDSFEEKQLLDTQRKKYRTLQMDIPEHNRKQTLRHRQKLARELRLIKQRLVT